MTHRDYAGFPLCSDGLLSAVKNLVKVQILHALQVTLWFTSHLPWRCDKPKPWHNNRRNVGKWTFYKCVVGSICGRSFSPMCATALSPRPSSNFSPGFLGCGALLVHTSFDSLQQWMKRTCNVLCQPLFKLLWKLHSDIELWLGLDRWTTKIPLCVCVYWNWFD